MTGAEAVELHRKLVAKEVYTPFNSRHPQAELFNPGTYGVRRFSGHIQDTVFGDTGKGAVTFKINDVLSDGGKRELWSGRINGGGNAGHEVEVEGKTVCTHLLPVAIAQRGATAFSTRGEFIHPEDLLTELSIVKGQFEGCVPAKRYVIDSNAVLTLDTHRAREGALNSFAEGGRGATGSGISATQASLIDRHSVTIGDLLSEDWEAVLRHHYRLYQRQVRGFEGFEDLATVEVGILDKSGKKVLRKVGSEGEFIDRLAETRDPLREFVRDDFYELFSDVWRNLNIAVNFEGAQAVGLDLQFGLSPDITAGGRPTAIQIRDATYGIASAEEVAFKAAVSKPYVSDVGIRRLPKPDDQRWFDYERWIRGDFNEFGRTTGRSRKISPLNVALADAFKKVGGWDYLIMTHLDASRTDTPIRVITHMTDRVTGKERPYQPYQAWLDGMIPHYAEFPGWDGEAVKEAKFPIDLPYEAKAFLSFTEAMYGKLVMATTGPGVNDYIPFWK